MILGTVMPDMIHQDSDSIEDKLKLMSSVQADAKRELAESNLIRAKDAIAKTELTTSSTKSPLKTFDNLQRQLSP